MNQEVEGGEGEEEGEEGEGGEGEEVVEEGDQEEGVEECLGEDQEDKMRSLKSKMEYMYLDNFVKTTPINNIFIPQQKNIDLIEDNKNKNKKVKKNINKL